MHAFLSRNRDELIERCKAKVALRPQPSTTTQLTEGIPLFIDQLTATLEAEENGQPNESLRISGASGGDTTALSEIGIGAAAHGKVLLDLGFTIEQVVHDYGDLCQAITDLAVEGDEPFTIDQFRTLTRCLDNAIADAVAGFALRRDTVIALRTSAQENERMGLLVHELRNYLQAATMGFATLEAGKLAIGGSTSGLVKRSLASLARLLDEAIEAVRGNASAARERMSIAALVADVEATAALDARRRGCTFTVSVEDPHLAVEGNRVLLAAALVNLIQNAFKFTKPDTEVLLEAYGSGDRVLIDVRDHCGGLPIGTTESLFRPFAQADMNRSGLGLGLSIARRSVQAERRVVERPRPAGHRVRVHDRSAALDRRSAVKARRAHRRSTSLRSNEKARCAGFDLAVGAIRRELPWRIRQNRPVGSVTFKATSTDGRLLSLACRAPCPCSSSSCHRSVA